MSTKPLKMLLACAVLLALSVISVAANPGYNREAARNYADSCCKRRCSPYNCGFSNDCQNFLSQVLNAGNLPQLWCADRWNNACWWFTSCSDHSVSWVNVPRFDHHCQIWNGVRFLLRPSFYYLGVGDPILANWPGGASWDHAAVYMGYGIAQEGTKQGQYTQLRSQHSYDRCRVWVLDYYPPDTQFHLWTVIW
jgi:hypothetical protein